jgi:hypothetical protein
LSAQAGELYLGNLTSEIRAVVLHTKAATENKAVIGTGNRDEDCGVAYYTLFGDGAVHMSPIGNLPKRLVREMAGYLGFEDLAGRVSTAGLEPGQTSFKDLGCDYEFAELVLNGLDQGLRAEELAVHGQVVTCAHQQMEKYAQWYGAPKFTSVEALVCEIIQRHEIALLKAEIVNPDMPLTGWPPIPRRCWVASRKPSGAVGGPESFTLTTEVPSSITTLRSSAPTWAFGWFTPSPAGPGVGAKSNGCSAPCNRILKLACACRARQLDR